MELYHPGLFKLIFYGLGLGVMAGIFSIPIAIRIQSNVQPHFAICRTSNGNALLAVRPNFGYSLSSFVLSSCYLNFRVSITTWNNFNVCRNSFLKFCQVRNYTYYFPSLCKFDKAFNATSR